MFRLTRFVPVPFLLISAAAFAADPYADSVVSFNLGSGGSPSYTNPNNAVGSPTRFTGVAFGFPSVVSPFSSPFDPGDIVSIGAGGFLTVKFDEPVTNDPLNPFGIDLLIFGNSFYEDLDYPNGLAGGILQDRGTVEVSPDGINWSTVSITHPDGQYPSLGYSDLTDPYATTAGLVPSDFTKPVDPSFDQTGKTFVQIVAGYNGSGGGTGVDLAAVSLSSISYVRVSREASLAGKFEIDGFADVSPVPAPAASAVLALAALGPVRRRRK